MASSGFPCARDTRASAGSNTAAKSGCAASAPSSTFSARSILPPSINASIAKVHSGSGAWGPDSDNHGARRCAARFAAGAADVGVLHGTRSLLLQDGHGNILTTHSISAGLDYPSVGPEHAWLASRGRTSYAYVDDGEALAGFEWLAEREGILPALESAHAIAWLRRHLGATGAGTVILVNLSGRGDKDVDTVRQLRERPS